MEDFEKTVGISEEITEEVVESEASAAEEAETSENDDTLLFDEAAESENDDQPVETEDIEEETEEEETEEEEKKPLIERTIKKAACIFLAALVIFGAVFAVSYIMQPAIDGVWRQTEFYLKGDDSTKQKIKKSGGEAIYYIFKDNGDLDIKTGTVTQRYNWSYTAQDGKKVKEKTDSIAIFDENNPYGETKCSFKIDGNRLSERKLTIETTGDNTLVYKFVSSDEETADSFKLKKDKSFKVDSKYVGTWTNKTNKMKLTLNKDGSYALDTQSSLQEGNYKLDDKANTIELTYFYSGQEGTTGAIPFEYKDKKIIIGTDEFVKK